MSDQRSPRGPSPGTQRFLISVAIFATTVAGIAVIWISSGYTIDALRRDAIGSAVAALAAFCVAASLLYGNVAHQLASLGHLKHRASCERSSGHESSRFPGTTHVDDEVTGAITVLVPSYKENLHLVRQTLLSVALQEHPHRRVVLLIDDPPFPKNQDDLQALIAARRLPRELQLLLDRPNRRLQRAFDDFQLRKTDSTLDLVEETRLVAALYEEVAAWFLKQAADTQVGDHLDSAFAEKVLLARACTFTDCATRINQGLRAGRSLSAMRLLKEYRRLASLFHVELTSFERKQFVNLSHEPNKAMNLNSYLGLIGKDYRMTRQAEGIELQETDAASADLVVPEAKYVIVVDADSLLMPDYVPKLTRDMERPENQRIAVAQSPYLSYPGSPGLLERTAAATVAVQYVVHLGFSQYEAVYWVGANAILRKAALDEICVPIRERGYSIAKYIQDRTHIEDTESTIDLVERGWRLHNSPEPLAYSATPADFGSLLIQRRRWANGGLIVLPRLLSYLASNPQVPRRWFQGFLRVGYLLNLSVGSLAVLLTFLIPLPNALIPCLVLAGICYALVYGADMVRMGFRVRDIVHIYALNLMLTPVHIGGAAKSIHQACTGQKTPFARTPKTRGRTWIPPLYVAAEYGLFAFCLLVGAWSLVEGRTGHAIWAFVNSLVFLHILINLLWDELPERLAEHHAHSQSGNSPHTGYARE
jgi:cellulose synthase/poly-beta-1,6-N-acetylglucosamine synthase-like glycosyltransferase